MSRVPIRIRLSLAFAGALAIVLATLGAFLYVQVRNSLDEQIAAGLRAHAEAVATGGRVTEEETVTQVIGADGQVVEGFRTPLVSPAERGFSDRGRRGTGGRALPPARRAGA